MDYNLGKTFKDVLKIVSLGVVASINGISGDVFAMDDDWGARARAPFSLATVRDIQGELDPKMLEQFALEDSMALLGVGGRPQSLAREVAAFQNQDARPRGAAAAAAAEDEEARNYALALKIQEELDAGILDQGAHQRGAAAAAAAAEDDDEDFKFAQALDFQEKLNAGFHDEGAHPRGAEAAAAAAEDDDADWKLAIALQFGGELNAGILDQDAHPRGAAAAAPKVNAKDWDVEPSALLHKVWAPKDVTGAGFVQYISRQSVVLFNSLKEGRAAYLLEEALPEIAARLKGINIGPGVSDEIDKLLKSGFGS